MADQDWFTQNAPKEQDWFAQNAPAAAAQSPDVSGTTLGQKLAIGAATGVRVLGAAGAVPLELLDITPPTAAARAGIGAAIGGVTDIAAQGIERLAGVRKSFSPAEAGVSAGLMAIPLGEFANVGRAARIGIRAAEGVGLGAGATQATSILESGRPASLKDTVYGAGIGGAFAGGAEAIAPKLADVFRGKPAVEEPAPISTAVKEVTENATQERQEQSNVQPERAGDGEGGASGQAGGSGGVQPEAQVQQEGAVEPTQESLQSQFDELQRQSTDLQTRINAQRGVPQPEQAPEPKPEIPEGAKATVNFRTAEGEQVSREMDAREAEGIFTKEKSSYKALLDCLGGA